MNYKFLNFKLIFFLIIFLGIFGVAKSSWAAGENIYVSQNGTGDGSSCNSPRSAGWFNTSANWGVGTGLISAGDTVHLCDKITTKLIVQGSGSSGNPITILFESGAKISIPASDCMSIQSKSYITVDGGTNGIIENTDNGTNLGNQNITTGIIITGSNNLEIKNLTIQNLYVHPTMGAVGPDLTLGGAIYANGLGSNISIHDNAFSDICWVITLFGSNGATNWNFTNNSFVNYDHGIAGLNSNGATVSGVVIDHNDFGSTANWDAPGSPNNWHHDGIHTFFGDNTYLTNVTISNNLFHGDWGTYNTAQIYTEQNYNNSAQTSHTTGWKVFNNVHIQNSGNMMNNGFATLKGDGIIVVNNTYLGASVPNSSNFKVTGSNVVVENNISSGAWNFINAPAATFSTLNNNLYANPTGDTSQRYNYSGSFYSTLAAWQAATGKDNLSSQVASAGLDSNGKPQTGSAAIGAGVNLTSLGIAALNSDKNGVARPGGSTAWGIGAYEYAGASGDTTAPAAPIELSVQ